MFVMIGEVSIHAPYIGSDKMLGEYNGDEMVSIHAPYIGSDFVLTHDGYDNSVSIHAPYIGSDSATLAGPPSRIGFNPRSLHRERLVYMRDTLHMTMFQSTLPT